MGHIVQQMVDGLPQQLRRSFPHAWHDQILTAVHDAILEYATVPDRFDPGRGLALSQYLLHAAYNNLLNVLRAERRRLRAHARHADLTIVQGMTAASQITRSPTESDLVEGALAAIANDRERAMFRLWLEGAPPAVLARARWLRLSELAGTSGRGLRGYEGVELSYNGRLLEVGAQLTLLRPQGGTIDLPFSMAGDYASSEQQAVWPATPGSRSTVLVGNASDQPVSIIIERPGGRLDELQLDTHETALLQNAPVLRDPNGEPGLDADWMRLTTVGPIGSVRATGYVEVQGRTVAGIRFYDPAAARQPDLYASNLPLAESVPVMVLKNTSATTISATPRFFPAAGEAASAVELTPVSLAAGQAKVVDLSDLVAMAANRPDLAHVSVAVMSTGVPGALIGGLSAMRHEGRVLSDIPLRDSGPIRQSTGTYPWRLDGDHDTVVSITNVTGGPARFHVHVRFTGGAYANTLELDPHATALFDLRELRDKAVPDREGQTIPQNATSGQFHWSILTSGGETKLAGRADITSRSAGRSTSYSCPDCCPDSFAGAFLDPWETSIPIWSTGDIQVLAQYMNCYQQYYTVGANSSSAWWDIQFPAVTSMQNVYSGLSRASGTDEGASSVWGYWDEELWHFAADYCWMEVAPADASGYVAVQEPVPSGETTLDNAWSGLIPTAYKWRARLSGGNFNGRTVREQNGGNDVDTCWWPGSQYAPMTGLSGGDWTVSANNEYGDDTVGFHWIMVDYYRSAGRAPCQFETDQIMQINRSSGQWTSYKTNRIKMGMTATTVWSYRDGKQQSKSW